MCPACAKGAAASKGEAAPLGAPKSGGQSTAGRAVGKAMGGQREQRCRRKGGSRRT